jgi:hypothetical protein
LLTGCEKYSIAIRRETVDRTSLASTYVGSPDPMQKAPPFGQRLVLQWNLPDNLLEEPPIVTLSMIFRNYTQKNIEFPITARRGQYIFNLLDEEYGYTGGFLTYKAELRDGEGTLLKSWKQRLWFDLIEMDE